jgi:hypothetical protein
LSFSPFLKIRTEKTMFYKSLMAAAASAAILVAAPAVAQGKGGGGGGGGAGGPPAGAGAAGAINSQGPMNGSPNGMMNASPNSALSRTAPTSPPISATPPTTSTSTDTNFSAKSKALENSQGPANASPNGIAHASPNSVLARGAVASSTLPGLTSGLVVNNTSAAQVGTVTKVITGPNNTIRAVVVTTSDGKTVTLPPSSLTISGNIVTTTSTSIGG